MIAHWMLYCVAVGTLLSAGAAALELALRPLGRATRWAWAGALLLTLAIPAGGLIFGSSRVPAPVTGPVQGVPVDLGGGKGMATARTGGWLTAALAPERLQTPLAALWIGSSAVSALALAAMAGALGRRRRAWPAAVVDGVPVLVSPDVGPAVVGLFRSRIVLPRWALEAGADARDLVLRHEQEHVRAGDPRLLAAALAAAVLTPWNPAVWWQLRRLRLAVEVDCDARVLARRADVHTYGSVLLEMGRRTTHARPAASAAFAEPVSTLERRIRIMTAPRVRRPLVRAAAFCALSAALAVAACQAPVPAGGPRAVYRAPGADNAFPRTPLTPQAALAQYYPDVVRHGMPAGDVLLFVVSADGRVIRHQRMVGGPSGARAPGWDDIPVESINSVDVLKRPAGELAPTGVQMVWVKLKDGAPSTVSMSRQAPPKSGL